jgi:alkanesulfonate monooxygenase SsuD/methylene tetrahydromethanopterin reductase-like flavin-dependent oxidoreductase (luciferase family)
MQVGLVLPMGDETKDNVPATFSAIRAMALDAESAGLDSVWVFDHLLMVSNDGPPTATWEAWSLLSGLAAATQTVKLGTVVLCNSFRHPGLVARMAHTVQEISGGRLILGLGTGWHKPEYDAFGFPFDHRVARFAESLEIIAPMLRDGTATFAGEYYTVRDCPLLPDRPAGKLETPILIGSGGGERMLGLVARWADAHNTAWYAMPDDRFFTVRDKLRAACEAQGRDPATVELTVGMMIGSEDKQVPANPGAVADAVSAWRELGVSHLICLALPTNRATVDVLLEGVALSPVA